MSKLAILRRFRCASLVRLPVFALTLSCYGTSPDDDVALPPLQPEVLDGNPFPAPYVSDEPYTRGIPFLESLPKDLKVEPWSPGRNPQVLGRLPSRKGVVSLQRSERRTGMRWPWCSSPSSRPWL